MALARIRSKSLIVGSDVFTGCSAQLGHPDATGQGGADKEAVAGLQR